MIQTGNTFDLDDYRLTLWREIYAAAEASESDLLSDKLDEACKLERYWAFPGRETLYKLREYLDSSSLDIFRLLCRNLLETLESRCYRAQEFIPYYTNLNNLDKPRSSLLSSKYATQEKTKNLKPYFEVLIIHPDKDEYEALYRNALANFKTFHDKYLYDVLFVDNYHDAVVAILSNPDIQVCMYVDGFSARPEEESGFAQMFAPFLQGVDGAAAETIAVDLKKHIAHLRPEIDQYYICDGFVSESHGINFKRIVYTQSISLFADMHSLILSGIEQRYSTPFFDALRSYAKRPKSVFHALPISQGQSIQSSHWIRDIADFYGQGIFSAETSSTMGGMDSIMDPKGSISQAQKKASSLFQSRKTYFITNGTTTANKIVMQANLHPGDVVLVSSDCHKSIPYSILLSGATPIFLETYPLNQYDLYGCVTLKRIKQVLLDLDKQGQLHRVKQITLTNSTFDGVIYDVKRYMMDVLAIKPDIIFHWDEAWFSFGYFNPLYQGKTAMSAANALSLMQTDQRYKAVYEDWLSGVELDDDYMLDNDLYPDPEKYQVRVYATQSVHKTLTAFRQASMLHVHDVLFNEDEFYEAYRTHTSTSPNYQIIASLDFARRQMSLEGYGLVRNSLQLAWTLRRAIKGSAVLRKYFSVLDDTHLIPDEYTSGETPLDKDKTMYPALYRNYRERLFVVDPTRVTVDISATGIDGPNFRQMLMTQYDIQVNKTSHNTILFIVNIGVDADNIEYLIESLHHIANKLKNSPAISQQERYVANLPLTRNYHEKFVAFQSAKENNFQAVDIRCAYYAGLKSHHTEYVELTTELMRRVMDDEKLVSAGFVTPYPPGFPIIVPGQLITYDILLYLQNIQIKEIHGYHSDQGLKVFTEDYLTRAST